MAQNLFGQAQGLVRLVGEFTHTIDQGLTHGVRPQERFFFVNSQSRREWLAFDWTGEGLVEVRVNWSGHLEPKKIKKNWTDNGMVQF